MDVSSSQGLAGHAVLLGVSQEFVTLSFLSSQYKCREGKNQKTGPSTSTSAGRVPDRIPKSLIGSVEEKGFEI